MKIAAVSEEGSTAGLPLRGVRITDFCWIGAGALTTKLLADHGAEVIRIETSTYVDSLRTQPPFKDGIKGYNRSGYFSDRNTNKESLALNLKHPAARDIALRLIARSDIVANNFAPGTMEKFGLSYEEVRQVRPDIIYLSMPLHGSAGPEHRHPGYGLTASAISGLHHLSGSPDKHPVGTGTNFPDHVPCPCHAAFAMLAALRHRRRTGCGQHIDLAQTEATISLLGPDILDYTVNGRVRTRRGNLVPTAAPNGVYPCAGDDRWIAIGIETDEQWRALGEVLEATHWTADQRFATVLLRHRHHQEIDRLLAGHTSRWNPYELMNELQRRGVPAGVVQDAEDVVVRDEQLRARGHWVRLEHPEMGLTLYNAPPFRIGLGPEVALRHPAPLLGQHTRDICIDLLGMSDGEVDRLVEDGVLI